MLLLQALRQANYSFVTPTPATHARVLARPHGGGGSLRDAFGWNRPFDGRVIDHRLLERLLSCRLVRPEDGLFRSAIRVSSLDDDLFVHSAYPTDDKDAVFFGPDSYRFAQLIVSELATCDLRSGARLADIGTGAGVGAIAAARHRPDLVLTLTDINTRALTFARVNAAAAGIDATFIRSDMLDAVDGELDVILANPPYIMDEDRRDYRHGGEMHGAEVALAMAEAASERLAAGGRFILYTGSAIIAGADPLHEKLAALAAIRGLTLRYREIDPDVFGEELEKPAYSDVERIALIAAILARP